MADKNLFPPGVYGLVAKMDTKKGNQQISDTVSDGSGHFEVKQSRRDRKCLN